MDTATIEIIKEKIKLVEAEGFGEVVVKIENGAVYRIVKSDSTIVKKPLDSYKK